MVLWGVVFVVLAWLLYRVRKQIMLLMVLAWGTWILWLYVGGKMTPPSPQEQAVARLRTTQAQTVRKPPVRSTPTDEEFLRALRKCDETQIQEMVTRGANANAQNEYESALGVAIGICKSPAIVRALINAGADVKQGRNHSFPLEWAVTVKSPEIVEMLLAAGTPVNTRPMEQSTMLSWAVTVGEKEIALALARAGYQEIYSPIFWSSAVESGQGDIMRGLLAQGQKIMPEDPFGFFRSSFEGNLEQVKRIVSDPANVERLKRTYGVELMWAVTGGQIEVLRFLWAMPDWAAHNRARAFGVAIQGGQTDIVRFMLENGMRISDDGQVFVDGEYQLNAVPAVLTAAQRGHAQTIQALLSSGLGANIQDEYRKHSPLQEAALAGQVETVKVLLAAGANPNHVDRDGQRALSYALEPEKIEIAKALVDAGADVNYTSKDNTPLLRWVRVRQNPELSDYLRAHGAHE